MLNRQIVFWATKISQSDFTRELLNLKGHNFVLMGRPQIQSKGDNFVLTLVKSCTTIGTAVLMSLSPFLTTINFIGFAENKQMIHILRIIIITIIYFS